MSLDSILNALNHSTENTNMDSQKFYAEEKLDCTDLSIAIAGIGSIQFPIQMNSIESLIKKSTAAKFGLREQTLLDTSIRNASEISADKISVQINQQKFKQMLDQMRDSLGLSENGVLTPYLHNLLIYGPGQFFKPHQDSEKIDGMVATLVIILPAAHIGGDLIIQHQQHSFHFESESITPQSLKCVAFYADCQHEVIPVKQGYRIALTYNLVLEPDLKDNVISPLKHDNPVLSQALKDYFSCEQEDDDPISLVYLLEHSYSEHSIRWPLLKGNNHLNSQALKAVAHELNLVSHLALAEIRQNWQTDGDEECPERFELIDEEISFSDWFDEKGQRLPYGDLYVSNDEICSAQELEHCEPDRIEAEGWMGNYGNTADYWYRRAAVILWRKVDQVVFHFQLNAEHALEQLIQLTELIGQEEEAKVILQRVHPLLRHSHFKSKSEFLNMLTQLSCYIQDSELASILLSKFPLKDFNSSLTHNITRWNEAYNVDWSIKQLYLWIEKDLKADYGYEKAPSMLEKFDEIILNLINQNADSRINALLIQHQINAITENNKRAYSRPPSEEIKIAHDRVNILNQTIKACFLQQDYKKYNQLIDYVLENPKLYPETALTETVLMLKNEVIRNDVVQSAYSKLRERVLNSLKKELAKGLRSQEDWSIDVPLSCSCSHCSTAAGFLKSSTEVERIWPLAADGRDHIAANFRSLELPIELSVLEGSRPYKLVMKKNKYLFINSEKRFKQISELYEKIMTGIK